MREAADKQRLIRKRCFDSAIDQIREGYLRVKE